MPKLNNEELKKTKYVSMADLMRQLDQIEDFDEKVEFTTKYLLSHGMDGQPTDYSFEEAVHIARLKLVDESKKLRDKIYNDENGPDPADLYIDGYEQAVNPYAEDEKDDIENQFFMGNPAGYLKAKAEKYAAEIDAKDEEIGLEVPFKRNCERLAQQLSPQMSKDLLTKEEKGMNSLNIQARLEARYRGRETFQKAEKLSKPSFFTRMFATRSNAGKNFDEVYAAFNNPKHALYGNLNALEKATTEYLAYKDSTKSAAERAIGLAVKEPKEGFATNLLEAIKAQKANDEIFKPVVGDALRKNLTQETVDQVKGVEVAEENPHRQHIILDLGDDEEENELDESSEKELENEKEVEEQAEQDLQA